MPHSSHITSVELYALDARSDRRGTLAMFHVLDVPNMEYSSRNAIQEVQHIYALIGYANLLQPGQYGTEGEQGESWLQFFKSNKTVIVVHKYWSDDQITAFRQIVEAMAPIYGWEVKKRYTANAVMG